VEIWGKRISVDCSSIALAFFIAGAFALTPGGIVSKEAGTVGFLRSRDWLSLLLCLQH
tara:strand:- start:505 stop:678 length:174 start_codon:yes stop_codon:yes gene_type:complete